MADLKVKIGGMSCASCASSIQNEVAKLKEVSSSQVNYALETGSFKYPDELAKEDVLAKVKQSILSLGFQVLEEGQKPKSEDQKEKENFRKFLIGLILSLSLFALAMWPLMGWPNQKMNWLLQFFLCTPIWLWIGLKFQKALLASLKTGRSNMNTLVGIGTSAAYLYSTFITFFSETSNELGLYQKVYFEAVGFIITFIFLGSYFEEKAKKKSKEALNSLLELSEAVALKVIDGGTEEVSLSDIQVGDILRVKAGGKFPVDGKVVKGHSEVDESMISGEPLPVGKDEGDQVFSGTINGHKVIDFKATKVGGDTFLSQIISYVENAQDSKPEIQKYADKISSIFVPIVIIFAILTFIVWFLYGGEPKWGQALSNFIAVLVIACPCALGLATPTAVVVATGGASLRGILIGGGEVIEKADKIDAIIFDKTGTLTKGKPVVTEANFTEAIDHDDAQKKNILLALGTIEQFSEHSLSTALVNFVLKSCDVGELDEPDSFETIKGKGLKASFLNSDYIIGNRVLLKEESIKLSDELSPKNVGSFVYLVKDKLHVATFVIGDELKSDSKDVINGFREQGLETWMITGDNEVVAEAVAKEVGIEHWMANTLPMDKALKVEELQKQGKKVAMVGDGINDAPALAKADLSLAMGTGTDVAMSTSDVTIVGGELAKVLEFLTLSSRTMNIIKQNLFLSLIYNALLIPIAAGVLVPFGGPMMPPVLASIAMGLSSISVVTNSLRISKRNRS